MSREGMLSRIRIALGRTAPATAPVPLRSFDFQTASLNRHSLIERFMLELEHVNGHAVLVHSAEQIRDYAKSLLPLDKDPVIAISDSVLAREPWIKECLESPKVRVVLPRDLDQQELRNEYKKALLEADLGITSCDYAIADTGTLVLISSEEQHQMISLVPMVHLCLLDASQLIENLYELLPRLKGYFDWENGVPQRITLITGPSRTADIEQTLAIGAHGPTQLHVLISIDRKRDTVSRTTSP
jgi:L-lactate dehydrogenase complex protein LldG